MTDSRPLIGLSGRRKRGADIAGMPSILDDLGIELFLAPYSAKVAEAGGLPVLLSEDGGAEVVDRLDGLVLTGGADIGPANYDADPDPELMAVEPDRDAFERSLFERALARELPVFGICRGMQLINVHTGGSLCQHVPEHSRFDLPATTRPHRVRFEPGTLPASLYGPEVETNSLHHQTLDRLGEGVVPVGWAAGDDDIPDAIESIVLRDRPVLAVQWHPEMLPDPDPGFAWLVETARN